jgi:hypothetical protein
MKVCHRGGSQGGHVLDGSSALKILILLAMNIIPFFVVVIVVSCTKSNWLKAKADSPTPNTQPHSDKGKTVGLLLRLCAGIAGGRGMVVILDSGFCVLQGLVELKKISVFASAVIKKRRNWPKYVPGELIDDQMKEKEIGDVDAWKNGTLEGVPYNIMSMKDVDYTMKLMSTYGSTLPTEAASNQF